MSTHVIRRISPDAVVGAALVHNNPFLSGLGPTGPEYQYWRAMGEAPSGWVNSVSEATRGTEDEARRAVRHIPRYRDGGGVPEVVSLSMTDD